MATGQRLEPLEMLARLVSFDTESSRSNLDLIAFVRGYLQGWGVPVAETRNADGMKAAIFATIGPSDRGGIVLSGHSDVVPVAGQPWSADPFTLRIADGRAYGRGAVDMKGFLALALALVPDMIKARLATPIHILISYDEETTCLGPTALIRRFGVDLPRPIAAIVGEPTDLEVADAHKSVVTFHTTVHGFEAHSSKPYLGANAVLAACQLVSELGRIEDDMRARGDATGRFDPAYTTVQACVIQGGTARNILAKECKIHWEFRGLPDLDETEIPQRLQHFGDQHILPWMRRHAPTAAIETINEVSVPGLAPDPGSPAESLALALASRNRTITVPYGTEAGHFQAGGVPTIVCGPGSINQAHQPDEYITLEAFNAGERFLSRLVERCRQPT